MNANKGLKSNNNNSNSPLNSFIQKNLKNYNIQCKGIFCSKCYSIAFMNIFQEKEAEEIFIELTCAKKHIEKLSLSNFLNDYQKYYKKECPICHFNSNINKLLYCITCKKIFCTKCKNSHYFGKNEQEHNIERFIFKDKKCKEHNFKLNEYYCSTCIKYLCQLCLKNGHIHHDIINLYFNIDKKKEQLKSIIEKEENQNKMELKECNELIVKINNQFKHIIEREKKISNIKKCIINNYVMNVSCYKIRKNLKLIEKSFYNKEKVKLIISKVSKKFEVNYNNCLKGNNKKSQKKKEKIETKAHNNIDYQKKSVDKIFENSHIKKIKKDDPINVINSSSNNCLSSSLNQKLEYHSNSILKNSNFNKIVIIVDDSNTHIKDNNNINYKDENQYDNTSLTSIEENSTFYNMEAPPFYNNYIRLIKTNFLNYPKIEDNNKKFNIQKLEEYANKKELMKEDNDQKKYYKIIQTKKNIKNIFCLSHNNIIISYDIQESNNLSIYKIIHDEKEFITMKHLKYINVINEPINDINKYKDESILICSNKNITIIKIINHEKGEYIKLFKYTNNNSNLIDKSLKKSTFKICLPLSNTNFITCAKINSLIYWKKIEEKEEYKLQIINIAICDIFSMKEIKKNLIVLAFKCETNNYNNTFFLLYLEIDNHNIMKVIAKKHIQNELSEDKNAIQKINDSFFLVILNKIGFLIIDSNKKEIIKKTFFNSSSILVLESIIFDEYLYNFVIEKNNQENKITFKQYKSKIEEIYKDKMKMEPGKDFFLNFKNNLNKIGIFFEKKENNNQKFINNEDENLTIEIVLVFGYNKIIIFDYYP